MDNRRHRVGGPTAPASRLGHELLHDHLVVALTLLAVFAVREQRQPPHVLSIHVLCKQSRQSGEVGV